MKENAFKENFKISKNLYNALKKDKKSVLFANEKINKQSIKKLKRSKYQKGIIFLKFYNSIQNVNINEKEEISTFVPFIEKREDIDNSTLYSFNGPFQLLHADIADIRFFSKSAADRKYCLLFVDLFTQKIYMYPLKKRNLLKKKMALFVKKLKVKGKGKCGYRLTSNFNKTK